MSRNATNGASAGQVCADSDCRCHLIRLGAEHQLCAETSSVRRRRWQKKDFHFALLVPCFFRTLFSGRPSSSSSVAASAIFLLLRDPLWLPSPLGPAGRSASSFPSSSFSIPFATAAVFDLTLVFAVDATATSSSRVATAAASACSARFSSAAYADGQFVSVHTL